MLVICLEGPKVLDLTAESVKKELETTQRPSQSFGSMDSSPPRRSRQTRHATVETDHQQDHSYGNKAEADYTSASRGEQGSSDLSPPRRSRNESADLSPPRRSQAASSPSHNPSGDISPPRRSRAQNVDFSPPRGRHSSLSDFPSASSTYQSDLSPPRHRVKSEFDDPMAGDISPPRRSRSDQADMSPPRRSSRADDLSPPRSRVKKELDDIPSTGDLSPPRNRRDNGANSPRHGMRMMNGERAGLQTGAEITAEARRRRAEEDARLAAMASSIPDDDLSTQTVYRDASGRKIIPKTAEQLATEEAQTKKSKWTPIETPGDRYREQDERDRGKGYRGRTEADVDRETGKAARDRWGDPLAQLKASGAMASDEEDDMDFDDPMRKFKKRKREHKTSKKSDTFEGWFPPNRFNLKPGALWDGVDRSNGFENKMYQSQIDRLHRAEAAYRYTSSEM